MSPDDDAEWWDLSAAISWIAVRQPLHWQHWREDVVPPRLGPSAYLSDAVRLPEAIKHTLASQDDGVDEVLASLTAALKRAAATGRVTLRGRGPWALDPDSTSGTIGEAAANDAKPTPIDASEFEREALQFELATDAIGPSDVADLQRSFPRWKGVTVKAADMRAAWPDPREATIAAEEARNETTLVERPDEISVKPPAGQLPSERSGRPRYTTDDLRFWFVSRRNMHFDKPPTEEEDLAAARAYFADRIPRDPFREIRRELTAPEWRKTGPRRRSVPPASRD